MMEYRSEWDLRKGLELIPVYQVGPLALWGLMVLGFSVKSSGSQGARWLGSCEVASLPMRAISVNTTTLRMKGRGTNGKKNIPPVKHPLINTNLFPGKAAQRGEIFSPNAKLPSSNLEIFPFSFKEY